MKTADGTRDGTGAVIGDSSPDHRDSSGYVLSGPGFLTMFNGRTGKAMQTVDYVPGRGTVSSWGDSYGNRVDRFLAGASAAALWLTFPKVTGDADGARVLRSVLMKPESEDHVRRLHDRVVRLARP